MNWEELKILKDEGHLIGAHGQSHQRLSLMDPEQARKEIIESGEMLDKVLSQRTEWYAYAYGDIDSIDKNSIQLIFNSFEYCRSGIRGENYPGSKNLFAQQIDLEHSWVYQRMVLEGGLNHRYTSQRQKIKYFEE